MDLEEPILFGVAGLEMGVGTEVCALLVLMLFVVLFELNFSLRDSKCCELEERDNKEGGLTIDMIL